MAQERFELVSESSSLRKVQKLTDSELLLFKNHFQKRKTFVLAQVFKRVSLTTFSNSY